MYRAPVGRVYVTGYAPVSSLYYIIHSFMTKIIGNEHTGCLAAACTLQLVRRVLGTRGDKKNERKVYFYMNFWKTRVRRGIKSMLKTENFKPKDQPSMLFISLRKFVLLKGTQNILFYMKKVFQILMHEKGLYVMSQTRFSVKNQVFLRCFWE